MSDFEKEQIRKWLKSHKNKTFFLYNKEKIGSGNRYYLIWNDTRRGRTKTKYGYIEDGAYVRYGFTTLVTLSSNCNFDTWKDKSVDSTLLATIFPYLLGVRGGVSALDIFNLENLVDLNC